MDILTLTRRRLLQAGGSAAALAALPPHFLVGEAAAQGSQFVGRLEGPAIVTDPAKYPASLSEAPALADLVKAGKLPPLAERLPVREDLCVVQPLHGVGTYGGVWRRGFVGPSDAENMARILASEKMISTDYTGLKPQPSAAKSMEVSPDGKSFLLTLRRGLKWSDGQPFTADDILFWYEHIYLNRQLISTPSGEFSINGKQGVIRKVSDTEVSYDFPEPFFLFGLLYMGDSNMGGGPSGSVRNTIPYGGFACAHHLRQFLPAFSSEETVTTAAKAAGYNDWPTYFINRYSYAMNGDLPVLGPWQTVRDAGIDKQTWRLVRNPYYHAVDTAGNQLPYLDQVDLALAENTEVLNLRAIAGEYDVQDRHIDAAKLPVLVQNAKQMDYSVHVNPSQGGGSACIDFNSGFKDDPEIAKWLATADFRRAMSIALDRQQFIEAFFAGFGKPMQPVPGEGHPHYPGKEWETKWTEYDPARASQMLDALGLSEKDSEGFRLRTDNGRRLTIQMIAENTSLNLGGMANLAKSQLREIGLDIDVKPVTGNVYSTMRDANQNQTAMVPNNSVGIWDLTLPVVTNQSRGAWMARWYLTGGKDGVEPPEPILRDLLIEYRKLYGMQVEQANAFAVNVYRIVADNLWSIGIVGQAPGQYGVHVNKNKVGNVPERLSIQRSARDPGGALPATFFFKG